MSAPAAEASNGAAPAKGGGSLMPLIITIVLMPVLAFVTTQFLVLPKIKAALGAPAAEHHDEEDAGHGAAASGGHGAPAESGGGGHGASSAAKPSVTMSKMVVNVAGTMGTRYLLVSFSMTGSSKNFAAMVEERKDQLTDLTIGALSSKTIMDLEKPGSRNQIRSELISLFNNALGSGAVQEIYFTEFAIQ